MSQENTPSPAPERILRVALDSSALVGMLNFHDALIALACQERGIHVIASFDGDFDQVKWLRRLASLEDVTAAWRD